MKDVVWLYWWPRCLWSFCCLGYIGSWKIWRKCIAVLHIYKVFGRLFLFAQFPKYCICHGWKMKKCVKHWLHNSIRPILSRHDDNLWLRWVVLRLRFSLQDVWPKWVLEDDGRDMRFVALRHQCIVCFKRFRSQADLGRHMRTHTGEKPYKCPYCERSMAQKGNLKAHIKNVHNDKLCPI